MTTSNQIVTRIEQWWDRSSRNWVVQAKDAEGHQVGAASFCGTKDWADSDAHAMACDAVLDGPISEVRVVHTTPDGGRIISESTVTRGTIEAHLAMKGAGLI